jgi:hypothetical protein
MLLGVIPTHNPIPASNMKKYKMQVSSSSETNTLHENDDKDYYWQIHLLAELVLCVI